MIQDIGNIKFDNQFKEGMLPRPDDYVFVFTKEEKGPDLILLSQDENDVLGLPQFKDLELDAALLIYCFSLDDKAYYLLSPGNSVDTPDGYEFKSNRALRSCKPQDVCFAAMTACHLNSWYKDNQHCGRCGAKTSHDSKLRMMKCPECGNMIFPKLCPAVTVALICDDKLLVSRYRGRVQTSNYALIAGFVEIGESAEECVAREVLEEVGLTVKNVKYFASQPWGFAGNLQIGYFAEVDGSAEITLDEDELEQAFFISREELEENPIRPALTQEMIELFRTGEYRRYL